jgi:hypothetical protein
MESSGKLAELAERIAALLKQQRESNEHASYVGWTPETIAEHDRRSALIGLILMRLKCSSGD